MNIYVGNLPYGTGEDELRQLFGPYGEVTSVAIIKDKFTGNSRGFGFVEMSGGGQAAIDALNGQDFNGRSLVVNEARPRSEMGPRNGGGGRGGPGGGGGFGNKRRDSNRGGGRGTGRNSW